MTAVYVGRGWTLAQVQDMARTIGRVYHSYGCCHPDDIRDAAYDAIVDECYSEEHSHDLHPADAYRAGMRGARRYDLAERRHRGMDHDDWTRPSYRASVWALEASAPTPSPETVIVDRLALAQVWADLPSVHQETLAAWAESDTRREAAARTGCQPKAFGWRLGKAKDKALRLWWDGDPIPAPYGHDRKPAPPSGDGALDLERERARHKNWRRRRAQAVPA